MIRGPARSESYTVFRWEHVIKSHYRLISGSTVYGGLSFCPEPSILFAPAQCEFYRATAQAGNRTYSFKCLFKEGEFCGCVAVAQGQERPVVLFEDHPAQSIWRSRSQLVLCEDGTEWPWLHGAESGQWAVLGRTHRILDLNSEAPTREGTLRIGQPGLMKHPDAPALILFSVYLAIGAKRQSGSALASSAPQS